MFEDIGLKTIKQGRAHCISALENHGDMVRHTVLTTMLETGKLILSNEQIMSCFDQSLKILVNLPV